MPNTFNAEIDKLRSAYEAAVAAGDASAMSPLLEEGAVFVRPGAPEWAAMAAAAPGLPFPPGAKIAISPIEVVELSKEWAYEFGTSTTTSSGTKRRSFAGGTPVGRRGLCCAFGCRRGGGAASGAPCAG